MRKIAVLTVVMLLPIGCASAQDNNKAADAKTGKARTVKFGNVVLDLKGKRIEVPGRVCLKEGILDFLAVSAGGQEYESVLALDAKGSNLHAALLAIGAKAGPTKTALERLKKFPAEDRVIPKESGTPLKLTVEWTADGKTVSVPAEHLLWDRKGDKMQDHATWVFTGSYFARPPEGGKEMYMADIDRTLVAVVYMASAVINIEEDAGNPYADEVQGYAVNAKLVPAVDTKVKVIITLAEKKKGD